MEEPHGSSHATSTTFGRPIPMDKVDALDWTVVEMNYSGGRKKDNRKVWIRIGGRKKLEGWINVMVWG